MKITNLLRVQWLKIHNGKVPTEPSSKTFSFFYYIYLVTSDLSHSSSKHYLLTVSHLACFDLLLCDIIQSYININAFL